MINPVLVVDDDPQMRAALREAVQRMGFDVVVAEDGKDGLNKVTTSQYSMVITDMQMPRMGGLELLKEIRIKVGKLPVLIITGFATVENAVEAMKEGAVEYLMKPFSFDTLSVAVGSVMERYTGAREIVTASPAMERLLNMAQEVARTDTTVLVTGESGTGKELIARFIHRMSPRKDKPFVAVNCAAIPESLMESELFGFEKGAFTGAIDRKQGKFELADGGTLLLDEIGEMPMPLQAKLLRVLQEREVDRVGAKQPIPIDIRVIATTNRDLYKESMEGRFREDLYYRLSVVPMQIPPLRERPEDVTLLSTHFIKKFSASMGKKVSGLTPAAKNMLLVNPWRGNVRELENSIQRAVLLSHSEMIDTADFLIEGHTDRGHVTPAQLPGGAVTTSGSLHEIEKEVILRTLKECDGNKTLAAKKLGVTVRTVRNKLAEYGENFS